MYIYNICNNMYNIIYILHNIQYVIYVHIIYIYIYIYIYVIMKTMCPPVYHHNGFVATHALGHMMYDYPLLVPMNQRVLNKLSKEHNISDHNTMYIYGIQH